MTARRAPSTFAVVYPAAVLGALVVVAVDALVGAVALLTLYMVATVYCLVQAERAQSRYRRRLAAKVATRPWTQGDIEADEDALVVARRARLAESIAQPAHGRYDHEMQFSAWSSRERAAVTADAGPRRVVIDCHVPMRDAS